MIHTICYNPIYMSPVPAPSPARLIIEEDEEDLIEVVIHTQPPADIRIPIES